MDIYSLTKNYWDWAFENPELVSPNTASLYFFCIEHCNRLGWKEKFGLPTEMAMSAIGVKNYKTYYKAFSNLVEWDFIRVITKSKNQYSTNIIALVKNTKANTKALTKARLKHMEKQVQSTVDIDIQYIPNTILPNTDNKIPSEEEFLKYALSQIGENRNYEFSIKAKYESWVADGWKDGNGKKILNWKTKLKNTLPHLKPMQMVGVGTPQGNYKPTGKELIL